MQIQGTSELEFPKALLFPKSLQEQGLKTSLGLGQGGGRPLPQGSGVCAHRVELRHRRTRKRTWNEMKTLIILVSDGQYVSQSASTLFPALAYHTSCTSEVLSGIFFFFLP